MAPSVLALANAFLLIFSKLEIYSAHALESETRGELVFTSILYRHGERNPDRFYKNDPYKKLSFWPDGLGMLTKKGKLEQYKLGRWLRERYGTLIKGGKYSHDLIYVQSTEVDRTLMSALANLAGMFYPSEQELWCDLHWQPIPVHAIPKKFDKLLAVKHQCPKIKEEERVVKQSETLKNLNQKYKGLYKHLTKHAGDPIQSPGRAGLVYTNLLIESLTMPNFTLPPWAESVYPDEVYEAGGNGFALSTLTKTLKRLKGGPLLKDMVAHMNGKRKGTLSPDRNLWIYSGHDTTLAAFLNTLGVFSPHMPPFSATVMVDLRKDGEEYFVSVHYKNSTEEPAVLTIPGCTLSCPLDTFQSLLSDVIPDDWDKECQV